MRLFRYSVLCLCVALSRQFLFDEGTCAGRCGHGLDQSQPCQCNSACHSHSDCCTDYDSLCEGTGTLGSSGVTCSTSFSDATEALWRNDVNRLSPSQYTVNYQSHVSSTNSVDQASSPFFTHVDESVFTSRPTFRAFVALLDNYIPTQGAADFMSSIDSLEVDTFLNEILKTSVMQTALTYLKCRGLVHSEAEFRSTLRSLWFTSYSRTSSGSNADSSGFEHVMVGEYKGSNTVNGLHNWIAYYFKEKDHHINYYGYVGRTDPNLVALNYMWNGHQKELGSFFLGTSPEFEMALYTVCALTNTGSAHLNGNYVHIQTHDIAHVSGQQIASAYPSF